MIVDLTRFMADERPYWNELVHVLDRLADDPQSRLDLTAIRRFHYLYGRASADLARLETLSAETSDRLYLENLVARAYAEIHETRERPQRLDVRNWFLGTFPETFRRHLKVFYLALLVTIVGVLFGALALLYDAESKEVIMPWPHLKVSPSQRVAQEEKALKSKDKDRLAGKKATFSSYLMTHNTRVAIFALGLGLTFGIGTILLLFYNGVLLGAVALDFIRDGQTVFLLGWLLPHGAIEIPAIIMAGQAGLVLGHALMGWGRPIPLKTRLRSVMNDLLVIIGGVAVLLVWAGLVEAFLSQYHEPVLPYAAKIALGLGELGALIWFLWFFRPVHRSGSDREFGSIFKRKARAD